MIAALLLAALPVHAADRVSVCHVDDDGATLLVIGANAVDAHLAHHGDTLAGAWYPDADGDGHGDAGAVAAPCPAAGLVDNADDCDDADPTVHPGAVEECGDGVDDTCDGVADEGCAPACPCFTAEDLDATWTAFVTAEPPYPENELSLTCADYGSGSVTVSMLSVSEEWRYAYLGTYAVMVGYERELVAFDVDGPGTSSPGCAELTYGTYLTDGGSMASESSWDGLDTTDAEAEACSQLVFDWAAANGLTCE